jgi:hypothetical protein
MNLNKKIKSKILETKEKKEKFLIEEKIVKGRIYTIFENEKNIKNFKSLPEEKKIRIAFALFEELSYQNQNNLLTEDLTDIIKNIFGNGFSTIGQTIAEPAVNWILTALGMDDTYLKKFMVSFLTGKEGFWNDFSDCRALTKAIASALAEAVVMQVQQSQGLSGAGWTALRNALGTAIRSTEFESSIENSISSVVCSVYDKFTGNASKVLSKLKSEEPAIGT